MELAQEHDDVLGLLNTDIKGQNQVDVKQRQICGRLLVSNMPNHDHNTISDHCTCNTADKTVDHGIRAKAIAVTMTAHNRRDGLRKSQCASDKPACQSSW